MIDVRNRCEVFLLNDNYLLIIQRQNWKEICLDFLVQTLVEFLIALTICTDTMLCSDVSNRDGSIFH